MAKESKENILHVVADSVHKQLKKGDVQLVFNGDFRRCLDADVLAITSRSFFESVKNDAQPFWRFRGKKIIANFDTGLDGVEIVDVADDTAIIEYIKNSFECTRVLRHDGFTPPDTSV